MYVIQLNIIVDIAVSDAAINAPKLIHIASYLAQIIIFRI